MTQPDYIEQRDTGFWILGTRVSLDSVVYRFLEGLSPETIQADCFPTLTLDQVYGAISYYLTIALRSTGIFRRPMKTTRPQQHNRD
jgi:hypothetical protein